MSNKSYILTKHFSFPNNAILLLKIDALNIKSDIT